MSFTQNRNSSLPWATQLMTRSSRLRRIRTYPKSLRRLSQTSQMRLKTATTWKDYLRSMTSNLVLSATRVRPTVRSWRIKERVSSTRHGETWQCKSKSLETRKRELWLFVSLLDTEWSTRTNKCYFATSMILRRNSTKCTMQKCSSEIWPPNVIIPGSSHYSLAAVRNMLLLTRNCALALIERKLKRLKSK